MQCIVGEYTSATHCFDTHKSCLYLQRLKPDITLCVLCQFANYVSFVKSIIEIKAAGIALSTNVPDASIGQLCTYLANILLEDNLRVHILGALFDGISYLLMKATNNTPSVHETHRSATNIEFQLLNAPVLLTSDQHNLFARFLLATDRDLGVQLYPLLPCCLDNHSVGRRLGSGVSAVVDVLIDSNQKEARLVKRFSVMKFFVDGSHNLQALSSASEKLPAQGCIFPKIVHTDEEHLSLVLTPVCRPSTDFEVPVTLHTTCALVYFVHWCRPGAL